MQALQQGSEPLSLKQMNVRPQSLRLRDLEMQLKFMQPRFAAVKFSKDSEGGGMQLMSKYQSNSLSNQASATSLNGEKRRRGHRHPDKESTSLLIGKGETESPRRARAAVPQNDQSRQNQLAQLMVQPD